jgi:hypothetical protein
MRYALYRSGAGLCDMRIFIHSEGGMKSCMERKGEFEAKSKTVEKGVL